MNNFVIDSDYLVITLGLVLVYFVAGRNISRGKSYLWNSVICVIAVVFAMGTRYDRGNDYMHYIDVYLNDLEEDQLFFTYINDVLKSWDVSPILIFAIYAIPFGVFSCILLYKFRNYAKYLLPLFIIAWIQYEESMIRQMLGFSFGFVYLYCLFSINIKKVYTRKEITTLAIGVICFAASVSIHSANFITLSFITAVWLLFVKPVKPRYTIIGYLIATLVIGNMTNIGFLNPLIDFLASQDSKFSQYADNYDTWFGTWGFSDRYELNIFYQILDIISQISIIYVGYVIIRRAKIKDKSIIAMYNVFVLGVILFKCFPNFEAINRITRFFAACWCFPVAVNIYYCNKVKLAGFEKILFLCQFLILYQFGRYLFLKGEQTKFLWDVM